MIAMDYAGPCPSCRSDAKSNWRSHNLKPHRTKRCSQCALHLAQNVIIRHIHTQRKDVFRDADILYGGHACGVREMMRATFTTLWNPDLVAARIRTLLGPERHKI
jgi:hypothetical protein